MISVPNNFFDLIKKSSLLYKNNQYLIDDEKKISFKEIFSNLLKFNSFLNYEKVKLQNKIVVIYDNSNLLIYFLLMIMGTFRIFVPINPFSSKNEVEYILKLINPEIIFTNSFYSHLVNKKYKSRLCIVENILNLKEKIKDFKPVQPNSKNKKNSHAEILFTSGSTGKPKGVVLTHYNIIHNLKGLIKNFDLKEKRGNYLSVTPLYHNNGQFIPTFIPLILGCKTYTIPPMLSIDRFFSVVKQYKINYSSVMATHISYFAKTKNKINKSTLKFLCCGGAKLDVYTQKKFEKKFKIPVLCNYGLTETSSIACSESLKNRRLGSVGKSLFNNKIKIKKENNQDDLGEIIIKGSNIFSHYLNNPKETKKKKRKNYLFTGDLGKIDSKGNFYILDRLDNMIIVSGENIYPYEIEKYTNNLDFINLSIVCSVPDELTQRKLVLLYELKKNYKFSKNKTISYLNEHLTRFKIPKVFLNIKKLGVNEIFKAQNKKILRAKNQELLINFFKKNQNIFN